MKKRIPTSILILLCVGLPGFARAEWVSTPVGNSFSYNATAPAQLIQVSSDLSSGSVATDWSRNGLTPSTPIGDINSPDKYAAGPATLQVPEPPSSLVMGLTAILGLWACRASRSVNKIHFSTLPDWYHDGGPHQIGHATPYSLDSDNLSLSYLDELFDLTLRSSPWNTYENVVSSLDFQFAPTPRVPRAPPC